MDEADNASAIRYSRAHPATSLAPSVAPVAAVAAAPVAPAAPVGLVGPVGPTGPVGPIGLVGPVSPVASIATSSQAREGSARNEPALPRTPYPRESWCLVVWWTTSALRYVYVLQPSGSARAGCMSM